MNAQESIKILRNLQGRSWGKIHNLQGIPKGEYDDIVAECNAIEVAIEALERQQAKKPDIWGDGYADGQLVYDSWDCPNCGKTYELEYEEYKHCPECGQKLDWSDE